jgi:hypothetical protein
MKVRTIRQTLKVLQVNLGKKKKMAWDSNQGRMYMNSLIHMAANCTPAQIELIDAKVDRAPVTAFNMLSSFCKG